MARFPLPIIALLIIAGVSGCLPNSSDAPPPQTASAPPSDDPKDIPPPPPVAAKVPDPLKQRIEAALASVQRRDLLTTNSFWTVFHGILGMGPTTTLKDPETGKRYNALDYIFSEAGGNIRGLRFTPTDRGLDVLTVGMGFDLREHEAQGHQDQFLAEMIQWGVPADREIRVASAPGRKFKFQDFVEESKARCLTDGTQELSWSLIVVAEYGGGTEAVWTNRRGEKLTFDQILDYELKADMSVAACGGTHRLFGVAWAYHRHMAHCKSQNKKPTELWDRARQYLEKYKTLSRDWQHSDGGFSTAHYREREHNPELDARMAASGHILEWLSQYVSEEEIHSPWMENGARAVAQIILEGERVSVASGSLYHAAHGLATYHARRYGSGAANVAKK
jgi:hypothetical protein